MALINVTRQAETLQAYQLNTPDEMMAALKYISQGGYGGHINCTPATAAWTLGISNSTQSVAQSAVIGDWIVIKNSAVAEVVTNAQFVAMYTQA